jgi:hypothetical protein
MIRIDLLKYLAHLPRKGNLDLVVARAINITEPTRMQNNKIITG